MKRIRFLWILAFWAAWPPMAAGISASSYSEKPEQSAAPVSPTACGMETDFLSRLESSPSATITDTHTPTLTEIPSFTPTETPSPSPRFSPTGTLAPSRTLTPSRTFTPTQSPFATGWPGLASKGPYLAYISAGGVVILNPDGSGRKLVRIPGGWSLEFPPGGEWGLLTEDRGSVYDYGYADTYLRLMRIIDGSTRSLGLIAAGDTFAAYDCYEGGPYSGYQILDWRWSPDGRYFAFTADPAGKSVDLYVFDTATGKKSQLTRSIGDIVELSWSPDSRNILFKSGKQPFVGNICCYSDTRLGVTRPENGVNEGILELPISEPYCFADLSGGFAMREFHRWIGPDTLLFYRLEWTGDYYVNPLLLIDLGSKESRVVWRGSMLPWNMEFDPEEKTLLVYEWGDMHEQGYYQLSLDGKILSRSEFDYGEGAEILYRGGSEDRFLLQDGTGVFGVTRGGEIRKISDKERPSIHFSPDHKWMILADDDGIDVFDETDERTAHSDRSPASIVWNPDGTGFYFSAEADGVMELYFWATGDPAPKIIFSLPAEDRYSPRGRLIWMD